MSKKPRIQADFNGLFGDLLCIAHSDMCIDDRGSTIALAPGMAVTAFEEDADKLGRRDDLIASGVVEPSPDWLRCHGSRWVLRIDKNGVRNESEMTIEEQKQ